jgi:hypothetical protein
VTANTQARALALAAELRTALDDPKRYEWGEGPWEHLGDAERDVRALLDALAESERQRADYEQALERSAAKGCQIVYGNRAPGFTCLDFAAEAADPDARFVDEYRARILRPDYPCLPCQARQALARAAAPATTEGGK